MILRREFVKIALAALPASSLLARPKINSTIGGVLIGAQSYSFREKPLDGVIQAMVEIGLGECELFSPHIEDMDCSSNCSHGTWGTGFRLPHHWRYRESMLGTDQQAIR